MSFENVGVTIKIIVAKPYAHAAQLLAVAAHRQAAEQTLRPEGSVVVIHEQEAGSGIARNKYIGPTVLVYIECDRSHSIRRRDAVDAGRYRCICERAIAVVAVERMVRCFQSARATIYRQSFIGARGDVGIWFRRAIQINFHIVRHKQMEVSITIEVQKCAASSKAVS